MKTGYAVITPNIVSNSAKRARFFALLLAFCISVNNLCPRAIIELKNYDVVVLAMGSQSVFLHLFALPSKVSMELATLLFGDSDKMTPLRAAGNKNTPKTNRDSSTDFSILSLDKSQTLKSFELGAAYAGSAGVQIATDF